MISRVLAAIVGLLLLAVVAHAQSVGLVQNGEQCFQTATGPVSSGSVNMYIPNTTNYKTTWQNSAQTVQNTNPISLDANGCAIIWGSGSYRQQLYTGPVVGGQPTGNLVFDLTTTINTNNVYWAGLAGGSANVILVSDPGFAAVDGTVINFLALATNTGATTLNPSNYGAYPILKATTQGLVALTGTEITQGNPVSVVFSSVNSAFLLLNPPIQSPAASGAPLCGAVGYKVVSDSASPNTTLDITANSLVTVAGTGLALNRSNVSVKLNFSTNGANGLDTGSVAASTYYNVWLIDNGLAPAALGSLSATSPTLPNGYSYLCRLSTVPTDASAHLFNTTTTLGNRTFFGDIALLEYTGGTLGTCPNTFVATGFYAIPTTATSIFGHIVISGAHNAAVAITAAGGFVTGVVPGVANLSLYAYFNIPVTLAQNVYICTDAIANAIQVNGWQDDVNAN